MKSREPSAIALANSSCRIFIVAAAILEESQRPMRVRRLRIQLHCLLHQRLRRIQLARDASRNPRAAPALRPRTNSAPQNSRPCQPAAPPGTAIPQRQSVLFTYALIFSLEAIQVPKRFRARRNRISRFLPSRQIFVQQLLAPRLRIRQEVVRHRPRSRHKKSKPDSSRCSSGESFVTPRSVRIGNHSFFPSM